MPEAKQLEKNARQVYLFIFLKGILLKTATLFLYLRHNQTKVFCNTG
jgi:hypothetical protein